MYLTTGQLDFLANKLAEMLLRRISTLEAGFIIY